MKFGILSTAGIAGELCQTINELKKNKIVLDAVYSRSLENAEQFKQEHKINNAYDNYQDMLESDIDVVYIASPNALHFKHAKEAIEAGKHVLIEKPIAQSAKEVTELYNLAHENNVFVMEALVSLAKEPLRQLKVFLETEEVKMIDFHFAKQTRHYNEYVDGKFINVFSSEFAGGAINDLGIYTIYPLNYLFGEFKNIHALKKQSMLGADESAVVIGTVNNTRLVTLHTSKVCASLTPSQIMTTTHVIEIPQIGVCDEIIIRDLSGNEVDRFTSNTLKMEDEITHFVDVVESGNYRSELYTEKLAKDVAAQMREIRNAINI